MTSENRLSSSGISQSDSASVMQNVASQRVHKDSSTYACPTASGECGQVERSSCYGKPSISSKGNFGPKIHHNIRHDKSCLHEQRRKRRYDKWDSSALSEGASAITTRTASSLNLRRSMELRNPRVSGSFAKQGMWRNSNLNNPQKGERNLASPRNELFDLNVCRFYEESGYCHYGNSCRYHHLDVDTNAEYQGHERIYRDGKFINRISSAQCLQNRHRSGNPYRPKNARRNVQKDFQASHRKKVTKTDSGPEIQASTEESVGSGSAEAMQSSAHAESAPSSPSVADIETRVEQLELSVQDAPSKTKQIVRPSVKLGYLVENLSEEELTKLRQTEISQLLRRFINAQDNGDDKTYAIQFKSSDPDWPYEVNTITLEVVFPDFYPKECFEVKVIDVEECLPELLVKHLNKQMREWIEEKQVENKETGRCQLLFRTFLHWLDRNLEDIFTNGLRAVKKELEAKAFGIEFVIHEDLPGSQAKSDGDSSVGKHTLEKDQEKNLSTGKHVHFEDGVHLDLRETQSENAPEVTTVDKSESVTGTMPTTEEEAPTKDIHVTTFSVPSKRGTEIKFRSFFLADSAATLICQKLFLSIQCARCKTRRDILLIAKTNYSLKCEKCHLAQLITFRPDILHEFSSVVGYLDLSECQAVDVPLMNCVFQITCLACDKRGQIDGIHYGQQRSAWCQHCNVKMTIFVDSVKFHKLQSGSMSGKNLQGQTVTIQSKVKKLKDPAITEGKPLPDCGTCRHYKKSFRWLRFPCCGKMYPCDLCHNEKETDHEMKYATRMICGFCAKEQPYSTSNPCIACNSSVTKKPSSHWEGGKGCRDRIKMSKDDVHKYSGKNKTVSKKAAGVSVGKKKSGQQKTN